MPAKNSPTPVKLKKIWIFLALIAALFVATIVCYNLFVATRAPHMNQKKSHGTLQTLANKADVTQYQNHLLQSAKPVANTPVNTLSSVPPKQTSDALQEDSHKTSSLSSLDPETLKAMSAPINSNQMMTDASALHTSPESTANASLLKTPSSAYLIQAGTFIPGILITGINSDLPGQIIGQVRTHVYDSPTGRYCLIPQGSKLIGVYDAKIIYGQARVLVAWQRLMLPNGQSMDLSDMAGVDNSGYAGFTDRVDAHYTKLLGSAVLTSVLGAGAQLSLPQTDQPGHAQANTLTESLAQNVGTSLVHTASELTNKNMNIQPTLDIRPGYTFNISVTKDLVFPKPYVDTIPGEVQACVGK